MYNELKTKCEKTITDLMEVASELTEDRQGGDVKAGALYQTIQHAANGLNRVISTIDAYYSEE